MNTVLLAALLAQLLAQFCALFFVQLVFRRRCGARRWQNLTLGQQRGPQRSTPLMGLVRRGLLSFPGGHGVHRRAMALGRCCRDSQAKKTIQGECFEHGRLGRLQYGQILSPIVGVNTMDSGQFL